MHAKYGTKVGPNKSLHENLVDNDPRNLDKRTQSITNLLHSSVAQTFQKIDDFHIGKIRFL